MRSEAGGESVVVISPFRVDEVLKPRAGGPRIVYEQLKLLRGRVVYIPMDSLGGLVSIFARVSYMVRKDNYAVRYYPRAVFVGDALRFLAIGIYSVPFDVSLELICVLSGA